MSGPLPAAPTSVQPPPAALPIAGRIVAIDPALVQAVAQSGGDLTATVVGRAGGVATLATSSGEIALKLAMLLRPNQAVTLTLPPSPAVNGTALVTPAAKPAPATTGVPPPVQPSAAPSASSGAPMASPPPLPTTTAPAVYGAPIPAAVPPPAPRDGSSPARSDRAPPPSVGGATAHAPGAAHRPDIEPIRAILRRPTETHEPPPRADRPAAPEAPRPDLAGQRPLPAPKPRRPAAATPPGPVSTPETPKPPPPSEPPPSRQSAAAQADRPVAMDRAPSASLEGKPPTNPTIGAQAAKAYAALRHVTSPTATAPPPTAPPPATARQGLPTPATPAAADGPAGGRAGPEASITVSAEARRAVDSAPQAHSRHSPPVPAPAKASQPTSADAKPFDVPAARPTRAPPPASTAAAPAATGQRPEPAASPPQTPASRNAAAPPAPQPATNAPPVQPLPTPTTSPPTPTSVPPAPTVPPGAAPEVPKAAVQPAPIRSAPAEAPPAPPATTAPTAETPRPPQTPVRAVTLPQPDLPQAPPPAPAVAEGRSAPRAAEVALLLQGLARAPLAEPPTDLPRPAPAPAPPPPAPGVAEDGAPDPTVRPDLAYPGLDRPDWDFDEPAPRTFQRGGDDAMIAEADLSRLGLFRLETRTMAGGFAMVVRHAEPLGGAGLDRLAEAVAAEATRFGVRARVRFSFDPTLRPTT